MSSLEVKVRLIGLFLCILAVYGVQVYYDTKVATYQCEIRVIDKMRNTACSQLDRDICAFLGQKGGDCDYTTADVRNYIDTTCKNACNPWDNIDWF